MAKSSCCKSGKDVKALVFQGKNLSIIQGAESLVEIDLSKFFAICKNYLIQDLILKADSSIELSPGNMSDSGQCSFIFILAEYPDNDEAGSVIDEGDKFLSWGYPGEEIDMNIGKLMVLSGTPTTDRGWNLNTDKLIIKNPHENFEVKLKILIMN
jgi:hypothetical protein